MNENLTAEKARGALLRLVESDTPMGLRGADASDIEKWLKSKERIQELRNDPIRTAEDDYTFIGGWTCRMKPRTFFAVIPLVGGHEYRVNGEFRRAANGTWEAVVMGQSHGRIAPDQFPDKD
jgi:hypothetical protein